MARRPCARSIRRNPESKAACLIAVDNLLKRKDGGKLKVGLCLPLPPIHTTLRGHDRSAKSASSEKKK